MSSHSNSSSSSRFSECDLVFDKGNRVSPVPEEVYKSFDLNVYSLGVKSGTISRTDRDPKDAFVYGRNTESKQHESDASFDCHIGEDVEWLAKPPVLIQTSA